MSEAHSPQRQLEVKQLLLLRQLRERQAMAAFQRSEEALRQIQAKRDEHAQSVQKLHDRRAELAQDVVTKHASSLGRLSDYVSATYADLDDQLERMEDAWLSADEACENAQARRDEARQEWLRASSRKESAQGLQRDVRQARRLHIELLAEREDLPSPPRLEGA